MIIRALYYTILIVVISVSIGYTQTDPSIAISDDNVVNLEDITAFGADLCLFLGYPSQGGQGIPITFTIADLEDQPDDLEVMATSSNISVVPQLAEFLAVTKVGNQVSLRITPIKSGSSSIRVIVEDTNWDAAAFNIHLTVKECQSVLNISTNEVNALNQGSDHTYQAANRIESAATIPGNKDLSYQAGQMIDLLPGFCVPLGNVFMAVIQDCE